MLALHLSDCFGMPVRLSCIAGLQFPLCLSLLEEGKIQTEPLITHRLGFSEAEILKGFQLAGDAAKSGAIKVMFIW